MGDRTCADVFLSIIFLRDHPAYMVGLIMIGLARCIAMVIVWNELAEGNREYAAGLVALNSIFQVLFYSLFAWIFITVLPPYFGLTGLQVNISIGQIAQSVFIYLGIPFIAGFLTRYILRKIKGDEWLYHGLYSKNQSGNISGFIIYHTGNVQLKRKPDCTNSFRCGANCHTAGNILYHYVYGNIFGGPLVRGRLFAECSTFIYSGRQQFELAIAVAIGVFGINSGEAFAGVIGPLVEVPALIALVNVAFWLRRNIIPIKLKLNRYEDSAFFRYTCQSSCAGSIF